MTKKPKHFESAKAAEFKRNLPRCSRCGQLVGSIVNKNNWTKTHLQKKWMFPQGRFPDLCAYCEGKLHPPKVGKES